MRRGPAAKLTVVAVGVGAVVAIAAVVVVAVEIVVAVVVGIVVTTVVEVVGVFVALEIVVVGVVEAGTIVVLVGEDDLHETEAATTNSTAKETASKLTRGRCIACFMNVFLPVRYCL